MKIDNPRVRADCICPVCRGLKDLHCVVCWPCNRKLKDEHDGAYGHRAEMMITAREHFLTQRDERRAYYRARR